MLLTSLHLFFGSLLVTRSLPMTTLSTTIKAVMVVCPTRRLIFIVDPKFFDLLITLTTYLNTRGLSQRFMKSLSLEAFFLRLSFVYQ
jgi:hypothetical protein